MAGTEQVFDSALPAIDRAHFLYSGEPENMRDQPHERNCVQSECVGPFGDVGVARRKHVGGLVQ